MSVASDPFEDPVKQKKYLKIALFGKGGTGKTRFALSFPKVCIVDSEKGSQPYIGRYEFQVKVANRWRQLEPILTWIRAHPGVYETLVIDSATVFYLDLIQDIIDYIKNKRGNETMTHGDWGVEKRRFAAFLGMLTELPMNVILSFREKDEYSETTSKSGEEIRKKTGEFLLDADKQTEYLFDIALRCFTEENKKTKESKFLVACTKTRYDWMPKYSVHDVTKKRAFKELFEPHVGEMLDAPDAPVIEPTEPILIVPDGKLTPEAVDLATPPGTPEDPPPMDLSKPTATPEENQADLKRFFGVTPIEPDQPEATLEDIKVLMTKSGEMRWPDDAQKCRKQNCDANGHIHPFFAGKDGKSLIYSLYNVESTRDLRKPQVDFLHLEFGKVLAGRAFLDRDGQGTVYVATPSGVTEEEVKARVLQYAK
jgi:hypothetical protein